MKYLHSSSEGFYWLDHRLVPEVRAMLGAMVSRLPEGGIRARYHELVKAVAAELGLPYDRFQEDVCAPAEDALTSYPLPAKVQSFMDRWVVKYGHASILEQAGSPNVFIEGISRETAFQLFDSPLVHGQEFSTRAIEHPGTPCREIGFLPSPIAEILLQDVHDPWMSIYRDAVDFWRETFQSEEARARHGVADKEPFSAALDRARVFLPGTIAVAASYSSDVRERARTLHHVRADDTAQAPEWAHHWEAHFDLYRKAIPGFAHVFLDKPTEVRVSARMRDRWAAPTTTNTGFSAPASAVYSDSRTVWPTAGSEFRRAAYDIEAGERCYVDPTLNDLHFLWVGWGSLAAFTDFHRHRPGFPWRYRIESPLPPYEYMRHLPISLIGRVTEQASRGRLRLHDYKTPVLYTLPLGASAYWEASFDLPSLVYMLRLRSEAHGANFEYKSIAQSGLKSLRELLFKNNSLSRLLPMLGLPDEAE